MECIRRSIRSIRRSIRRNIIRRRRLGLCSCFLLSFSLNLKLSWEGRFWVLRGEVKRVRVLYGEF